MNESAGRTTTPNVNNKALHLLLKVAKPQEIVTMLTNPSPLVRPDVCNHNNNNNKD
jgi:hypothetical protein